MKIKKNSDFRKAVYLLIVACISISFFFFLSRFTLFAGVVKAIVSIIRPFIIGAVFAYLLIPVNDWLMRRFSKLFRLDKLQPEKAKKRKKLCSVLSILLSIVLFLFLLFALFMQVLPQTMQSVTSIFEKLPAFLTKVESELEAFNAINPEAAEMIQNVFDLVYDKVSADLIATINEKINFIVTGLSNGILSVFTLLKDLLIGLIVAIYILGSRKTFKRQSQMLVMALFPKKKDLPEGREQTADFIFREASILNNYLNGFVKGKIIDSFIIGVICLIFCLIARMPYAELVSVIIGVTNIIPFFGPFIGAVPTILIILMVSPVKAVVFLIFVIILQQIDGNIIGPYILGNATKLSSFWVLFAILLFGGLFGIPGMILGVPVFGFIYQLIRELIYKKIGEQTVEEMCEED